METTEGGGQQRVVDNRGWETTEGGGQQRVVVRITSEDELFRAPDEVKYPHRAII